MDHDDVYLADFRTEFVILDVDDTCVACVEYYEKINPNYTEVRDIYELCKNGTVTRRKVVLRNGIRRFFNTLKERKINVIIWSAGCNSYVAAIVDILFPSAEFQPIQIRSKEHTHVKKCVYKPLINIIESIPSFSLRKAIVIDDREESFEYNKKNAILVPRFSKHLEEDPDDIMEKLNHWFINDADKHINSSKKIHVDMSEYSLKK